MTIESEVVMVVMEAAAAAAIGDICYFQPSLFIYLFVYFLFDYLTVWSRVASPLIASSALVGITLTILFYRLSFGMDLPFNCFKLVWRAIFFCFQKFLSQ